MKEKLTVMMIFLALYLTLGGMLVAQQPQPSPEGSYQEAPKDDPAVVSAAKFAVGEQQQKEGGTISLVSIKRADTKFDSGLNYRLCLKVKANDKTHTVTTVVNKSLTDKYSLTSWETGGCKKAVTEKSK